MSQGEQSGSTCVFVSRHQVCRDRTPPPFFLKTFCCLQTSSRSSRASNARRRASPHGRLKSPSVFTPFRTTRSMHITALSLSLDAELHAWQSELVGPQYTMLVYSEGLGRSRHTAVVCHVALSVAACDNGTCALCCFMKPQSPFSAVSVVLLANVYCFFYRCRKSMELFIFSPSTQ